MITAPPGWFAAYHDPSREGVSLLPLVGWEMLETGPEESVPTVADFPSYLARALGNVPAVNCDTRGFPLVSRLDGRVHYAMDIYGFICVTGPGQDAFSVASHIIANRKNAN
jgi:hypothetical protein